MNHLNVNLSLSRNGHTGSTQMRGKVGKEAVNISIDRQGAHGETLVSGNWGGKDNVDLVFSRSSTDGYTGITGEWRGREIDVDMDRRVSGDTFVRSGGDSLEVDRNQNGTQARLRGSKVTGSYGRTKSQGDEEGRLRSGDDQVGFRVDRDPRSGDFVLSGTNSEGGYHLNADLKSGNEQLNFSGTLPEGAEELPLLWEILGDDKLVPDNNPMYPSSLLALSLFVDQ